MKMYVVYADSNPTNVLAIFKNRADAEAFQVGASVAVDVRPCIVASYDLTSITHVDLV